MGTVSELRNPSRVRPERVQWVRRRALQIASELPEDRDEALAVLREAESLVRSFLCDPRPV